MGVCPQDTIMVVDSLAHHLTHFSPDIGILPDGEKDVLSCHPVATASHAVTYVSKLFVVHKAR